MSSPLEHPLRTNALWQDTLPNSSPHSHTKHTGRDSTLREGASVEATVRGARARLAIGRIDPDPRNPRVPSSRDVEDLARSLVAHGLLQPIVVRPVGQRYMVVAGHRRLAAWCRCASDAPSDQRWRTIEAVVRDVSAEEALTLMLVENLQRKSLSPLQEAVTLQRLRVERNWTNRQVAEAVHKSEMYVSRRLRVLDDSALRDAVLDGRLAVTTAEELLAANPDRRASLVANAIAESWSPADARHAVHAAGTAARHAVTEGPWRAQLAGLQRLLQDQPRPPAPLRADFARLAAQLLEQCQA